MHSGPEKYFCPQSFLDFFRFVHSLCEVSTRTRKRPHTYCPAGRACALARGREVLENTHWLPVQRREHRLRRLPHNRTWSSNERISVSETDNTAAQDLASLKLPELRKMAAERGLRGVSALRRGSITAIKTGKVPPKAKAKVEKAVQVEKAEKPEKADKPRKRRRKMRRRRRKGRKNPARSRITASRALARSSAMNRAPRPAALAATAPAAKSVRSAKNGKSARSATATRSRAALRITAAITPRMAPIIRARRMTAAIISSAATATRTTITTSAAIAVGAATPQPPRPRK